MNCKSSRPKLCFPACAALLVGVLAAPAARAQNTYDNTVYYFPNSTTIGNLNGGAVIGYANAQDEASQTNGTSPTVNVTGTIAFDTSKPGTYSFGLSVYNASTANINGGSVSNLVGVGETATLNLNGGSISGGILADGTPTLNVSGGTINGGLSTDGGVLNVTRGTINRQTGSDDALLVSGPLTTNISGGQINGGVSENTVGGTVTVSGGTINGDFDNDGYSPVTVSGGQISGVLAANANGGSLTVSGGSVLGGLADASAGPVTVSGGTFGRSAANYGANFLDATSSALTFVGTGLGAVPTGTDQTTGGEDFALSGFLRNGSSVTGDIVDVEQGATMFTLVNAAPEPSQTAALGLGIMGLGGLALRARRRARA